MSADQPKPPFEPPPWEQEAFERFRKAQDEQRAKQELNAALRAALDQPMPQTASAVDVPAQAAPTPSETATPAAPTKTPESQSPTVSEAKVAAMLIELRREETPVKRVNITVVNSVMGFMTAMGLYIIIRGLLLAGSIQTGAGANTLMASMVSLVVFVTGCAFLGGAYLLFRKYHR